VSSVKGVQERTDDVSYEAFLASSDETHAKWVGGKIISMSPPSERHQDLSDFLGALLRVYAETQNLGLVRSAPFQMKLSPEGSGREPDLLFVAEANWERLKKNCLEGPADLVVEIISPESRARDRGEKFYEYEAGGVREYWLIDPDREQAEFYGLDERGIYQLAPLREDVFESHVLPGLRLEAAWLWRESLPPLLSIIRALQFI
jgi:Uma2 family endonuclease